MRYQRTDILQIRHDLIIPEPQHLETLALQECFARTIARRVHVLSAIDLDDKPRFQASEVRDVRTDGKLAAETEAVELAQPQNVPQPALRQGHVAAQLPGPVALLSFAHGGHSCIVGDDDRLRKWWMDRYRERPGWMSDFSARPLAPIPTFPRRRGKGQGAIGPLLRLRGRVGVGAALDAQKSRPKAAFPG